ncbi:MAG TPA: pyrroline-5-carboxylate reductase [Deinococcales bacterium]|nr:pyrroline-5-carboxylate reductase [Deinococcales bacterium]
MRLAIVGAGKMGEAFLEGVLNSQLIEAPDIGVIGGNSRRAAEVAEKYGVRYLTQGDARRAERVLICVQPKNFVSVAEWVAHPQAGYISIMAGVSLAQLARRLGTRRVVRAMPNLAATIHRSATAVVGLPEAEANDDLAFARSLFAAVGDVYELPEHLFNTFTGMVGSGPAYAAIFAEALADGGVRMGLDRKLAIELAGKLLISTGELLLRRVHPSILKDEVASPGGTTVAGIAEIERYTFRAALMEAVRAATLRGGELGQERAEEK